MTFKEIQIKQSKPREIIIKLSLDNQKELINQIDDKKRGLNRWLMD